MIELKIPAHLATLIPEVDRPRGPVVVPLPGGTWGDVAHEVRRRLPKLAERVLTASGTVTPGFVLVVNSEVITAPDTSLQLAAGDELCLLAAMAGGAPRALIVDLNNFARYPTLAIGYLVASLRGAGFDVDVMAPLAYGVPAVERERPERLREHVERRVYMSTHPVALRWHDALRAARGRWIGRPHPRLVEQLEARLREQPVDVMLLSAYLDHYPTVVALGELAARHDVPVLVGGPAFTFPGVAERWLGVPGVRAVVAGEVDLTLPDIVNDLLTGKDLSRRPGVLVPDGKQGPPAPPLHDLARLPVPDFTDFPWDRYPSRVIPAMTGRGCDWGRCQFCADVHTANGRTFRSRPVDAVLDELEEQAQRHRSTDFIFLDLKLNSNLAMWRGLIDRFQSRLPGARWIGWLHIQGRGENGLTADELRAARAAGLTRITFGFESGSQHLNDLMAKGTRIERTSQFVRDAHAAGISVRMSAIVGYPGETAADIRASSEFLETHFGLVDRVRLGLFKPIPGTPFQQRYDSSPSRFPGISKLEWDYRYGRARYEYDPARDREYRRAKVDYLGLVHKINSRRLRDEAQVFEGLM